MRRILWAVPALFVVVQVAGLAATILPGTEIPVRPDQPIDVNHWDRGRIYPAHVARDVFARDGDVAIPRGSQAELIIRQTGPGQYSVDLESITVNGQRFVMDTAGPQYNMPASTMDNGSGLVGSIVGAIASANGERVEPRGGEIHIPAGAMIRFNLQEPLHVAQWADPGYESGPYHYHHDRDWYR